MKAGMFQGCGLCLLGALMLAGLVGGGAAPSLPSALKLLWAALPGHAPSDTMSPLAAAIVLQLRLPRVLLAALVGSGLAMCGATLQTVTRNDLADPFIFGLSSGAAAGAAVVITRTGDQLGIWTLPLATLAGAALSTAGVVLVASRAAVRDPARLVVCGLAMSFVFGAFTDLLVFTGDRRAANSVLFWMFGSFGLARWSNLPLPLFGDLLLLVLGLVRHRRLDALLAGEQTALSLGVDPWPLRRLVFAVCAVGTASFVALTGVVGFVGLMVPPIARRFVGIRHRAALPAAALAGAVLLEASDLLSRSVLPNQELPVGIVTSAMGGLFVLATVLRRHDG